MDYPIPTPKEVTQALMKFEGHETRDVHLGNGDNDSVTYLKYSCPKPECSVRSISFRDKTGYKNPFTHLKSCYGKGMSSDEQTKRIYNMYRTAQEAKIKNGGSIYSHFASLSASPYEKSMYAYLRLVIIKNMPLSMVENEELRKFSRHQPKIGRKTLVDVIFALVSLVEKAIGIELSSTQGALLFDGWSINDTHYIAALGSYCSSESLIVNGKQRIVLEHRLTLLGLSPMSKYLDEEDKVAEATTFNAEMHVSYFQELFQFYSTRFGSWVSVLIGDNTSTNHRISKICQKPFVGCHSHRLNLEVNFILAKSTEMTRVVESVHRTMRSAK